MTMLTVVTATLNAARFVAGALASVPQDAAVEHIVVDGGSADETLAVCREFPWVETVAVPGCSIYEAWNIGIERTRGDWIMFLNADDEFADDAAATVAACAANRPAAEIVAGRAQMIDRDDDAAPPRVLVAAPSGRLDTRELALGVPAINAIAFRRSLFERDGRFDTIYRVAGDRAFLLRLALQAPATEIATTDAVLYRYYVHAGSLTLKRGREQRLRIARDHVRLASNLLAGRPPRPAARVLRYWRRREAAVGMLRCAAAGRPVAALAFAGHLVGISSRLDAVP